VPRRRPAGWFTIKEIAKPRCHTRRNMHTVIGYSAFVAWFALYSAYRYWVATGKVIWLVAIIAICAVGCTQDAGLLP
jgi:hypothetical protein